jgi:hypothetical protein
MLFSILFFFACTNLVKTLPTSSQEPDLNCVSECEVGYWECTCAFELKSDSSPDCLSEFQMDHNTSCEKEHLSECLEIVIQQAQSRGDTELVLVTKNALTCILE